MGRILPLMVRSLFTAAASDPRRYERRLSVLRQLLEDGKPTPMLDRTFPLSEVPEAIEYLASGKARVRVVIAVQPSGALGAPSATIHRLVERVPIRDVDVRAATLVHRKRR